MYSAIVFFFFSMFFLILVIMSTSEISTIHLNDKLSHIKLYAYISYSARIYVIFAIYILKYISYNCARNVSSAAERVDSATSSAGVCRHLLSEHSKYYWLLATLVSSSRYIYYVYTNKFVMCTMSINIIYSVIHLSERHVGVFDCFCFPLLKFTTKNIYIYIICMYIRLFSFY